MQINAGLWIDHREAVIVVLSNGGEATTRFLSGAEKHPTRESAPSEGKFKSHQAPADDSRQHAFSGHLDRYYDNIVFALRDADSILIFGPGEAKEEFRKRFSHTGHETRPLTVETTGQMTGPQIAAKVRLHFRTGPQS